jgi:hypothetical protein
MVGEIALALRDRAEDAVAASVYPTLGDRLLAAWQWDPTRFYLYDTVRHVALLTADYGRTSAEVDHRPQITGRLLAWSHATTQGVLELRWAILPD